MFVPYTKGEHGKDVGPGPEQQPVGQMGAHPTFNELVAQLAAGKVENEVLRQSLILPLGPDSLGRLMTEQVLYAWMGILLASIKDYSEKDQEWASRPLAQAVWQVVHEEFRTK